MFIGQELDDPFGLTAENIAQLFQRIQRDGFVVLQIVDRSGVDAVFVDEGVSGNMLAFHGLPQRLITDHGYPLTFQMIRLLSFEKWGFTILKKVSIIGGG